MSDLSLDDAKDAKADAQTQQGDLRNNAAGIPESLMLDYEMATIQQDSQVGRPNTHVSKDTNNR